jgi:hypothetical protein
MNWVSNISNVELNKFLESEHKHLPKGVHIGKPMGINGYSPDFLEDKGVVGLYKEEDTPTYIVENLLVGVHFSSVNY